MVRGTFAIALSGALLMCGCGDDGGGEGGAPGTSTSSSSSGAPAAETTSTSADGDGTGSSSTAAATTEDPSTVTSDGTTTGSGDGSPSTTSGIAPCEGMSFFASSEGSGDAGGNLGGLEGADATCQALAEAVGQGACTWRAYLSTSTEDARDRIGTGPWQNFAGEVVAESVEALHTDGLPNGEPQLVMDENGDEIPGNQHDILTGSAEDGTYVPDATCLDWTSDSAEDIGQVGHSDIPANPNFSPSWNSAHPSQGCTAQSLQGTGGNGRLYCFAL